MAHCAGHICIYSYIYKYTSIHLSIASYRLYECVYFECLTVWQKCCFLLLLCVWLFIGGNGRQKSKKAMPNQTEESPTTSPKKMPAPHFPALFPPNQSATPRVWGIWPARVEITYIYATYISPPFLILFCSNIFFFFEWLSGKLLSLFPRKREIFPLWWWLKQRAKIHRIVMQPQQRLL